MDESACEHPAALVVTLAARGESCSPEECQSQNCARDAAPPPSPLELDSSTEQQSDEDAIIAEDMLDGSSTLTGGSESTSSDELTGAIQILIDGGSLDEPPCLRLAVSASSRNSSHPHRPLVILVNQVGTNLANLADVSHAAQPEIQLIVRQPSRCSTANQRLHTTEYGECLIERPLSIQVSRAGAITISLTMPGLLVLMFWFVVTYICLTYLSTACSV